MRALDLLNTFLGSAPSESQSLILPLVHMNLILYACAFWMQQPVMPEKIKSLEASELEYGSLQSFSAILALLGSTYIGRVIDVYGARTGLMLAQGASGILFLIAAFASTVNQMYLTAFPAFFQHAMLCCSAAVAALSSEERRAVALGRLGLSYGIGMAVGSPIGGWIAQEFGVQATFLAAAGLSICVCLVNLCVLPSLRPPSVQTTNVVEDKKGLDMSAVWRVACSSSTVRNLMLVSFTAGLATSAFRAMFALAAVDEFKLNSQELGLLMSFTAFISLVTNVFLIGWMVRYFGEGLTLVGSLLVQSVAFASIFLVSHLPQTLMMVSIPQAVASTVFYTLCSSMVTKSVSAHDQGTAISLSHAMRSLTQVLAPLIGGYIMRVYNFGGVGLFAAGMTLCGATFASFVLKSLTSSPEEQGRKGLGEPSSSEEKTHKE